MSVSRFLSNVFLFESLSVRHLSLIASFSSVINVAKEELLFSENDEALAFFAVISGKFKIFKTSVEGLEQILHVQKPFDLIAEASIFDECTYPASCVALEKSKAVRISKEGFRELILKNPDISLKLLKSYSQRLRGFVSLVDDLSLRDVKGRLANYLIKHGVKKGHCLVCELNTSKKELASALGTVPETLSRTIKDFKDKGLIEEKGKTIFVIDPRKIKCICG